MRDIATGRFGGCLTLDSALERGFGIGNTRLSIDQVPCHHGHVDVQRSVLVHRQRVGKAYAAKADGGGGK
ncbi:hypothetical protein OEG86_13940 [Hoeflea alexandrii]|uniref:hypothetical protein n=1 Tax=Hoeflea alexandrii TaxID=288436 RepID=UPI00226E9F11|nr:hypothetical protein [Hoeflea alexandrii]MCY0153158.1 hypothetical protein [Hoeflea alexandrii]